MTCRKIDSALKFFACLIDLQSFFHYIILLILYELIYIYSHYFIES